MDYYQLRIRTADDTADALVVTSVPSGTNPYISQPPSGDGQGFDPRTGATEVGAYTLCIADNGSTANVVTGFLSDGAGRYDKLGRRAYIAHGTNGTTFPDLLVAGYVTALSYVSAAEAQVTVGEAQRAERNRLAFSIADSAFPATTMLGGGPVRWPAGVIPPLNWPDRGPWTVKLFVNDSARQVATVQFVSGYVLTDENATDYTRVTDGAFPLYMFHRIASLTATESPGEILSVDAFVGDFLHYTHAGNMYADVYSAGALVGTFPVVVGPGAYPVGTSGGFNLAWANSDALGTEYQVYLYSLSVSESIPLHVFQHPVAIVTALITGAAEQYDATSAAAVTAAIGADARVFLRLVSATPTDAFIALLMALYGFGRRMNNANAWEFFLSRAKETVSGGTVTLADLREIPSDLWTLDEGTIINTVTLTTQRFALWAPGQGGNRPPDSLVPIAQKRPARFQLPDGSYADTTQGVREKAYDLPGTILTSQTTEADLTTFVSGVAAPVFDRWGYGAPSTSLACLPSVTAQIGDELTLTLSALPNGSARGGSRVLQVVQRTNEPGGPVLRVEDSGLSSQPTTAPTFTIAVGGVFPLTTADVTLTNAAALVAAGVTSVAVEFAVGASSPVVPGTDLGGITPSAPLVLTTPATAGGSTVWARARSVQAGRRPSGWTAWASVVLSAIGAPSGVLFTGASGDGSRGTLTWTAGSNTAGYTVDVLLRKTAHPAGANALHRQVGATSVAALVDGLTPSTGYTATIRYVDPVTGIVASQVTATFTAGASSLTLAIPDSPVGIVGNTDTAGVSRFDGTYGLDVHASEIPGTVEFLEAVETSVGAGTYGTAVSVARVPSVSGAMTSWRSVAPHDLLRRSLTARHVRAGTTTSTSTTAVIVDPWGGVQSPVVPGTAGFTTAAFGPPDYTNHWVPFSWTAMGVPVGATYTLIVEEQVTGNTYNRYVFPAVTSPYDYAPNDNAMIAGGAHTANLRGWVQMVTGASVAATSDLDERTFNIF